MLTESSGSVKTFYPRFSRDELVAQLRARTGVLAAELPLRRAVSFGSWASGRATAFSDTDVLIVYDGPPRDDAYKTVRQCLALRGLEPHIYTEDEATRLARTLERMTRNSVDLLEADKPEASISKR